LCASYTKFEKQFGTQATLESTVFAKRRIQYEEEVKQNGLNFDSWFNYAQLKEAALCDLKRGGGTFEEINSAIVRVREVYERAVAHVPPGDKKKHWRRYVFLWINYALFEEIDVKVCSLVTLRHLFLTCSQDYGRVRQVYRTAVQLVPHKIFTFTKLWICFTKFEIRRLDLAAARKILGTAIGMCPKGALFKRYIELEIKVEILSFLPFMNLRLIYLQLREFHHVRTLYQKYIEASLLYFVRGLFNIPCLV